MKPANFMHKHNSSMTKWWALESQPLRVRFEQNQNKNVDTDTTKDEPRVTRFGVWAHYYIKGQNAKVSLGVDSVRLNSEASNRTCTDVSVSGNCRNFTDVTLQFQTQF
jgi:hypothetical protein